MEILGFQWIQADVCGTVKCSFRCYIAKDRDASMHVEAADKAPVKVYTDGSAVNGGVGASAVLMTAPAGHQQVRKHYLGTEAEHMNYEAEVVGLMLAIHQIVESPQQGLVSIYTDNQSVLKAINSPPEGPAGYLTQEIVSQMKALRERRPNFARGIIFRWISSHSNVPGNEAADAEAKKAASGRSSRRQLLPNLLKRPLPASATTTRRKFHDAAISEWTARQRDSPRAG